MPFFLSKVPAAGLLRSIKVCWTSACKLVALFCTGKKAKGQRTSSSFWKARRQAFSSMKDEVENLVRCHASCLQFVYHFSPLRIASGMKSNMAEAPSWCIKGMKRRPAWKRRKKVPGLLPLALLPLLLCARRSFKCIAKSLASASSVHFQS